MDQENSVGLTSDETKALLIRASGAASQERALVEEEVITAHLVLATRIAGKYSDRGIDLDDLQQVGCMALVKAVRRFDADKGEFIAFATATVSGEIKKHFRDFGWVVRPPRSVQELQAAVMECGADSERGDLRGPDLSTLAATLGVDRGAIVDATTARGCFTPTSLDAPSGADGPPLGDGLVDDNSTFEFIDEWTSFRPAWDELTEDERELIRLRFFDELSQLKIAELLGISQMQVSRRLSKVLAKIRNLVAADAA